MKQPLKSTKRAKSTLGTKEWADYNVNCIKGCFNDCRYCYARIMAERFGRVEKGKWKEMEIREDVIRKKFSRKHGRIMFPSAHDISDVSPYKEACFSVLDGLLSSGNIVLVTTKPKLNVIKEVTQKFKKYESNIQFRFTITSNDDQLLEFWEPNAPHFKERLASLKRAFYQGFKTSVSIEPFLDYDPTDLVRDVSPFTTESIWIGRMNHIPRKNLSQIDQQHYHRVRKNYETCNLLTIYHNLKDHPRIRFKDSIRNQLSV